MGVCWVEFLMERMREFLMKGEGEWRYGKEMEMEMLGVFEENEGGGE